MAGNNKRTNSRRDSSGGRNRTEHRNETDRNKTDRNKTDRYESHKTNSNRNNSRNKNSNSKSQVQRNTVKSNGEKIVKIKKYKKPLNINYGMIFFGVILLYVIVCVVLYFNSSHLIGYEVKEGSLSTNYTYRGIILRDETSVSAESSGYINYYAREGERVANGNLVYTIDATGKLSEYLSSNDSSDQQLSDSKLNEFKNEIIDYMHGFTTSNFESVYDFKYSMSGTVLKLANSDVMEGITSLYNNTDYSSSIHFCNASQTGIVAYWTDGYENLTTDTITEACFDEANYEKTQFIANQLIEQGEVIYKISDNENWSVVIPIEEEKGRELEALEYVKVRFLKNQYESWAGIKLINGTDGKFYLQLSFTNSMITFIKDRYINIELLINEETGLKIPNSSIVQKEFYLIPEEYITKSGENGNNGVLKLSYSEDGQTYSEFIETDLYSFDKETKEYYLDVSVLENGDQIIKPDSQDTYTISKRATLIGVFNINKGYADFKQINILYQNEEYSIVKSNTQYGLNVYDYIVLNAESVTDNQFVYQ